MLTFAEQIVLLALDDRRGVIKELSGQILERALVGAVLMELALANRIDTDQTNLFVTDRSPTGDPACDTLLKDLIRKNDPWLIGDCLRYLSINARQLQEQVLEHLASRGILRVDQKRLLGMIPTRRYRLLDDSEIAATRTRLRELMTTNDLPDPRESVLASLIIACGLLGEVLDEAAQEQHKERIATLAKMDFIGQSLARSIRQIGREMLAMAMPCNPVWLGQI